MLLAVVATTVRPGSQIGLYSTVKRPDAVRPNTSGEYISSAFAEGSTYSPGVVARAV